MPFGSTNTPTFYTVMMRTFQDELDTLFLEKLSTLQQLNSQLITINDVDDIKIGATKVVSGCKNNYR